jgi:cell division protein FtsW
VFKSLTLPSLQGLFRWPLFSRKSKGYQSNLGRHLSSNAAAREVDVALIWTALLLLVFGLVMVYSATISLPDSPRFARLTPTHFLVRHTAALLVAIAAALVVFSVKMEQWQKWAPMLFALGVCGLILVLIPGIGRSVLGARRWLSLGPLNLQPSEFMKIFVVLYAADYTVRKQDLMQNFKKGFLPMAVAMGAVGVLLLLEPDMGAFLVMVSVAFGILFLGGVNGRLFSALVGALTLLFAAIIWMSPWRRDRIFAYLDPFEENNTLGRGYQLSHSLIAFGRGEWTGVGLGGSIEKLHYLPEAHTDFLLAVIGEELGLIGVLCVVAMFFFITRKAFEIGRQAIALDRYFSGFVAKGVGLFLGGQALFNMGVNVGLLPTKGLTLPLMSYGGTSIMVNCIAMALLLRADFENRQLMRGKRT